MANKRHLKKKIKYVCGDLAAETILAGHMLKGFTPEIVTDIINDIASLQVDALHRATFSFDKSKAAFSNPREYNKAHAEYYHKAFATINADFFKAVNNILGRMNAARKA